MTDNERQPIPDELAAVSSLAEPTRRALYEHVAGSGDAVGREAAAAAVGISRSLAAFHLDRLAEDGLVEVEYRRLTGRTGPGAGRPAKLYRRSARHVAVNLPPRQHGLAAEILAEAIERIDPETARNALVTAAQDRGRQLAAPVAAQLSARASRKTRLEALRGLLADAGFEPYLDGKEVRVRNCPFHPLSAAHVALVCGMNQELVFGAADALGLRVPITLDPRPGECCIVLGT